MVGESSFSGAYKIFMSHAEIQSWRFTRFDLHALYRIERNALRE